MMTDDEAIRIVYSIVFGKHDTYYSTLPIRQYTWSWVLFHYCCCVFYIVLCYLPSIITVTFCYYRYIHWCHYLFVILWFIRPHIIPDWSFCWWYLFIIAFVVIYSMMATSILLIALIPCITFYVWYSVVSTVTFDVLFCCPCCDYLYHLRYHWWGGDEVCDTTPVQLRVATCMLFDGTLQLYLWYFYVQYWCHYYCSDPVMMSILMMYIVLIPPFAIMIRVPVMCWILFCVLLAFLPGTMMYWGYYTLTYCVARKEREERERERERGVCGSPSLSLPLWRTYRFYSSLPILLSFWVHCSTFHTWNFTSFGWQISPHRRFLLPWRDFWCVWSDLFIVITRFWCGDRCLPLYHEFLLCLLWSDSLLRVYFTFCIYTWNYWIHHWRPTVTLLLHIHFLLISRARSHYYSWCLIVHCIHLTMWSLIHYSSIDVIHFSMMMMTNSGNDVLIFIVLMMTLPASDLIDISSVLFWYLHFTATCRDIVSLFFYTFWLISLLPTWCQGLWYPVMTHYSMEVPFILIRQTLPLYSLVNDVYSFSILSLCVSIHVLAIYDRWYIRCHSTIIWRLSPLIDDIHSGFWWLILWCDPPWWWWSNLTYDGGDTAHWWHYLLRSGCLYLLSFVMPIHLFMLPIVRFTTTFLWTILHTILRLLIRTDIW